MSTTSAVLGNYRIVFFLDLASFLAPPLLIATLIQRLLLPNVGSFLLLAITIPFYWTAKIQYGQWYIRREAARLGAVLAPEVKGRWPGNIDVLLRSATTF